MTAQPPRLFTIPPDKPFLEVLARAVLDGFPCTDGNPPGKLDLARWTILLSLVASLIGFGLLGALSNWPRSRYMTPWSVRTSVT